MTRSTLGRLKAAIGRRLFPRATLERTLLHHAPRGLPRVAIAFADVKTTDADVALAERLIRAWRVAESEAPRAPGGDGPIWEGLAQRFHGDLLDLVRKDDARGLAAMLAGALREPITHGMGPGRDGYRAALTRRGAALVTTQCVDRMAALAEALALSPYENVEQGRWGENLYEDPVALADRIEARVGVPLAMELAGAFGIRVRGGIVTQRTSEHAYVMSRIRSLLDGVAAPRIGELGAGYGGIALYCGRAGLADYRIFDLPAINVLQGYFLGRGLGAERVVLLGEPMREGCATVLPWWRFAAEAERRPFDLVVNQDSFPEIARPVVIDYVKTIRRSSRLFLSINQEGGGPTETPGVAQLRVPEIIEAVGGFRRVARSIYWMRKGYVEEVYETRPSS